MGNNPDYDACIAAGNSEAVCLATFGPPEGEGEGAGNITSLSQLANMQLFDLTRGGAPVRVRVIRLAGREGPGGYNLEDVETGKRYFAANRVLVDTLGNAYQVSPGGDVTTGNPIQSRLMTQSERNAAVSAGIPLLGVPSTASTARAPAWSSTQAGQAAADEAARIRQAEADAAAMDRLVAQLQYDEDEAIRNRDFETAERIAGEKAAAEAAALAAHNELKLARLGEAGALARTFEDIKARARDSITALMGKNPFRGAVRAAGGIPRGVDPYEAFEAELGGVANMPTPQFSSESNLGQIESAIAAMNEAQMPTSAWPMGDMGEGGRVRPGEVVKVGELGEPEYVYNRPDGTVEIIPGPRGKRIAGRAPTGGTYEFDKSSIAQVLGPVYAHLGFSEAPEFRGGAGGTAMTADALQRLGIQPRLVRDPTTGGTFWVDPEGVRRHISSPTAFREYGFDWADVVNMSRADLGEMYGPRGAQLTSAPPLIEPYPGGYPRQPIPLGFGKAAGELGHYALPAPRTIANLYRTFGPANREILLDALGLSEMGREQVLEEVQAFTPRGTAGRVGYG